MSGRQGRSGRRPGLGPERCGRVTVTVRGTEWRPPARQAVAASVPPRRRGAAPGRSGVHPHRSTGPPRRVPAGWMPRLFLPRRTREVRKPGLLASAHLAPPWWCRGLSHPTAADSWRFHERPLCAWGLACVERATCAFTPPGTCLSRPVCDPTSPPKRASHGTVQKAGRSSGVTVRQLPHGGRACTLRLQS